MIHGMCRYIIDGFLMHSVPEIIFLHPILYDKYWDFGIQPVLGYKPVSSKETNG